MEPPGASKSCSATPCPDRTEGGCIGSAFHFFDPIGTEAPAGVDGEPWSVYTGTTRIPPRVSEAERVKRGVQRARR